MAGHGAALLAMDKATGELIAKLELRDEDEKSLGFVTGTPMTYLHGGKQYIVLATSGGGSLGRLIALALP